MSPTCIQRQILCTLNLKGTFLAVKIIPNEQYVKQTLKLLISLVNTFQLYQLNEHCLFFTYASHMQSCSFYNVLIFVM